jgi:TatD DNase family protein
MVPADTQDFAADSRPRLTYFYQDNLYVNLTNRCPTACTFCLKFSSQWRYRDYNLKLQREPTTKEILREIKAAAPKKEIVFCGYGEPTYRLETLSAIGWNLKRQGLGSLRLNTVGLGNLIHGRDIVPSLALWLDRISISLNTADPAQWRSLMRPAPPFRERGFSSVLSFIESCVACGLDTTVTAVDIKDVDISGVKAIAHGLSAQFRLRPPI